MVDLDSRKANPSLKGSPKYRHELSASADSSCNSPMVGLKVFDYSDSWEYVGSGSYYQLSNEWRRYLQKPWRKRKLERIAGR